MGVVELPPPVSLIEISRVLEETACLVRRHAEYNELRNAPSNEASSQETAALRVRAIITARRLRRQYFGFEATDALWSMMLELYAARLEYRSLHQTEVGVAAGVPQTTALRITRRMLARGVFTTAVDPNDKRLLVIRLSHPAAERIAAYLAATRAIAAFAA